MTHSVASYALLQVEAAGKLPIEQLGAEVKALQQTVSGGCLGGLRVAVRQDGRGLCCGNAAH